jgi:hypothetical protein
VARATFFPAFLLLDAPNSTLTVTYTMGGPDGEGQPAGSGDVTWTGGEMTAQIDQSPGDGPPALNIDAISGSADMTSPTTHNTSLGTFVFEDCKLRIGLPAKNPGWGGPFPIAGGTDVDIGGPPGLDNAINEGTLNIANGAFVIDFSEDPLEFTHPEGSIASFQETGPGPTYMVELIIPYDVDGIAVPASENPLGFDMWYHVEGEMIWQGTKTVPEPGTIVLATMGLVGLLVHAIRRAGAGRVR